MIYADVIIDISHEAVDRAFQYEVPDELADDIKPGSVVNIPFGRGNTLRRGYVIKLSDTVKYKGNSIKSIDSLCADVPAASGRLLTLASWMKDRYGSTMIDAIMTVMPVRRHVRETVSRYIVLATDDIEGWEYRYLRKNATSRLRLLRNLEISGVISMSEAREKLSVSNQTVKAMESEGVVTLTEDRVYRTVVHETDGHTSADIVLNNGQRRIVNDFSDEFACGIRRTYLLHGVTGSGKTEIYVRCIQRVIAEGRQAIMLIPEIALSYQTVRYFTRYFGDRVTVINSRLSDGERYDQFERARRGDVDVVVGPRSALFTPFDRLGLIVIDEEHESSYKSDNPPKYDARETAIKRAELDGASVILGSATPSVGSYKRAKDGEFKLWKLTERVCDRPLAETSIVDLRDELRRGNRSVISDELAADISDRLDKRQQVLLFINRRGFNSFVSCRSCGDPVRCPHCDVSLTRHVYGKMPGDSKASLVCHYCGYTMPEPSTCPSCGSRLIGGYGVGTERVEQEVRRLFPQARVLRMDKDTTSKKNSYDEIIGSFARGEADVLIGTQMIVKGHDFANVTLVGILLADLTLFAGDYRAGERTFDLITQAAGRAGRGEIPGKVIIQTYKPDNYAIMAAAAQNYESFYDTESAYRSLMRYPPQWNMLVIMGVSEHEEQLANMMDRLYSLVRKEYPAHCGLSVVGPSEPAIKKLRDVYRRVIYIKHCDRVMLERVRDMAERWIADSGEQDVRIFYDFNPVNMY